MVFQQGEFQGRTVLSPQSVAEMTRLQNGENPLAKSNPMGLGFRIKNPGGPTVPGYLYHDGVSRNRSLFLLIPTWKAALIISVNDHSGGDAFLWELKEAFLKALSGS